MRWIVLVTVLALLVLVTSAPLWARSATVVPLQANMLAVVSLVGEGFRGTSEPVRLVLLGGALITGSVSLRRRRGEQGEEDAGD